MTHFLSCVSFLLRHLTHQYLYDTLVSLKSQGQIVPAQMSKKKEEKAGMKKLLKTILIMIGVIVLLVILLVVILLIIGATKQMAPKDYTETTPTGGEIEARYLKMGPYEVSYCEEAVDETFKKYEVYYPAELTDSDRVYPVVVFANGTGVVGSKYKALFEHLASWGFVVVGNEDSESWNGNSSDKSLAYILEQNENRDSVFYQKIDIDNIGISGHSQGGAAVFNAITEQDHSSMYKTAVSLSPTHEELAVALEWHYDLTQVHIPLLLMAGTVGEFETEVVLPLDKMISMFDRLDTDKVMARKTGCEHGHMLYSADGYVTAWFMWQLQGDEYAAGAFTGDTPEIMSNNLYQDQKCDLQ